MVEASDFDLVVDRDQRNRRGTEKDAKKRLNAKEQKKREQQMGKRAEQRNGTETAQEIKEEYDEINKEYLNRINKQKKAEEAITKAEEKKKEFELDFIENAIGPEPKNNDRKKKEYEERKQNIVASTNGATPKMNGKQRSNLLAFLKQTL